PYAGLIFDKSGDLYGTTLEGGTNGSGTVFELLPPATKGAAWTETVLHSFAGGSDGAFTFAGLIFDKSGDLYGVTSGGGANGSGTVFELTPPAVAGGTWTESVLHNFTGSDGTRPAAGLIF